MSTNMSISISRALTEQLSGEKTQLSEEKKRRHVSRADRETLAYIKENEEVREALIRSRRVGNLLLKREEEEFSKIDAQAKELAKHSFASIPFNDACQNPREAVRQCCETNADNVLNCSQLIDAYAHCANTSFKAIP